MANLDTIVCHVCGHPNPATNSRCTSCGARLEALVATLGPEDLAARRTQQDGFDWKWAFISFLLYVGLQGVFLVGLSVAIDEYDPQGFAGLVISTATWFVGSVLVGYISPGRTFVEPAVGALIAVAPTIWWLSSISDVHRMSVLAYGIGCMLGVMVTLLGAYVGEHLQMHREEA